MTLDARTRALGRLFVAACVGTHEETRRAIDAVRAADFDVVRVEETLLLVIAYAGIPRSILAFTAWREAEKAVASPAPIADRRKAGERTFAAVYGARTDRIKDELRALHPVLLDSILEDSYGRILARPGLPARDRELFAVAMLVALGAPRQAAAHAIGARREGVGDAEILEAAEIAAGWVPPAAMAAATSSLAEMLKREG